MNKKSNKIYSLPVTTQKRDLTPPWEHSENTCTTCRCVLYIIKTRRERTISPARLKQLGWVTPKKQKLRKNMMKIYKIMEN